MEALRTANTGHHLQRWPTGRTRNPSRLRRGSSTDWHANTPNASPLSSGSAITPRPPASIPFWGIRPRCSRIPDPAAVQTFWHTPRHSGPPRVSCAKEVTPHHGPPSGTGTISTATMLAALAIPPNLSHAYRTYPNLQRDPARPKAPFQLIIGR